MFDPMIADPTHGGTTLAAVEGRVPRRVLIADDDLEMRDLLASVLRRDGHEVSLAEDGPRLVEELERQLSAGESLPDLIISDVRMPGFGGLFVIAALRATGIDVPVLLITGFGDSKVHSDALGLGATLFDKPFHMDELRRAVRALVV